MTLKFLILITLACVAATVSAYSTYDLGNVECGTYLDKRGQDQVNGDVANTSYIHAYLSGYLTAGNMMHGLVGETSKDVSINIQSMVQWLDAWCLANRPMLVAVALESFWVEAAAAREKLQRKDSGEVKN